MYNPPTKQEILLRSQEYYKTLINEVKQEPFILNISLTSNPFIKDKDSFKFLRFQLSEYNKRIEKKQVKDPYEMLSYQKLHSILSDLAQIDSRQDQVTALEQMFKWFKEQQRVLQQRIDQGEIRYEMTKLYRDIMNMPEEKKIQQVQDQLKIPFYLIEKIMEPYRRHSRTLHGQLENPNKRLKEYKRKIINIATFGDNKEQSKPPRVLYPVPPKYQEPKQEIEEKPADAQPQEGAQPPPVQGVQVPPEGQPAEPQQPDMGGFGEQKEEPDQQQPPEDLPDKLRPKNPIYVDKISTQNEKKYKQSYMFYLGTDSNQERNMELRYVRKYHDSLRKHKEDYSQIEIAHEWAKKKAKITKDMQIKLEEMKLKPAYSFSKEVMPPEEKISYQDELKYGFTTAARTKPKTAEFDLSYNELPKLNQTYDEKSIRRDRLNSLKGKFGKLLNLAQNQDRQSAPSLCQYTSRRRGLSQIIRNHSHSKERLNQLEEVNKIKEKLTKVKININIKALSRGLCLPQNEDFFNTDNERQFPNKELPSNPDLVETKKKKKKK